MHNLVTVAYNSTYHYLVGCRGGYLLIDAGFAGTLPQLRHGLGKSGIDPSDVEYVMLTHHHPDHAGLTQEVKKAFGAKLLIHERQIPYLGALLSFYRRKGGYEPIVVERNDVVVTTRSSREALRSIGIAGEIVETPGHSEDSVSLVLDDGAAFVGDLHLPDQVEEARLGEVRESWAKLLRLGVRAAYPSHAGPIPADDVQRHLSGDFPAGMQ